MKTIGVLDFCRRERLQVRSTFCMLQILKTGGVLDVCRKERLQVRSTCCMLQILTTGGVLDFCRRERLQVRSTSCILQILTTSGVLLQKRKTPGQKHRLHVSYFERRWSSSVLSYLTLLKDLSHDVQHDTVQVGAAPALLFQNNIDQNWGPNCLC